MEEYEEYLKASDNRGLQLSANLVHLLNRRVIAEKYGCEPMQIDEWPRDEVLLELTLLNIETRSRKK